MDNEDFLRAGDLFQGGIAGQQQATCGAVAGAAITLGLARRTSSTDEKENEKARKAAAEDAAELVKDFIREHGAVTCLGLLGVDLSDEKIREEAVKSGIFKNCEGYVTWIIEKLYELENKREKADPA